MFDSTLKALSKAPATQLDGEMASRVGNLVGKDPKLVVEGIFDVLNECAAFGSASDFVMVTLNETARIICEDHKLDFDQLLVKSYSRAPKL